MVEKSEGLPVGATADALGSIRRVCVIGAGWVGRQIVGQSLSHGISVWWVDKSSEALSSGEQWLKSEATLSQVGDGWPNKDASIGTLVLSSDLSEVPEDIDLVIESVSEQISVKRQVFREVSNRFASTTIVTSNSSYFTPSMLKRFVKNPERFAHLHFHVPVWRTRLVDIVAGPETNEVVLTSLRSFAERIGQHALVQRVENPGYVFNCMLKSLLQSALQLKVKGVATPEEIDFAWKQVTNMELGPFGIMDQIGIDLIHQTMSAGRFVDGDEVWQPLIDELQPFVDQNKLGVKTGEGFYKH